MEQTNKLDEFFQQKLENHSSKPRAEAWEKLSGQLNSSKEEKSNIFLWKNWTMAASIVLLMSIGFPFFLKNNTNKVNPKAKSAAKNNAKTVQPQVKNITTGELTQNILPNKASDYSRQAIPTTKGALPMPPVENVASINIISKANSTSLETPVIENTQIDIALSQPNTEVLSKPDEKIKEAEPLTVVFTMANYEQTNSASNLPTTEPAESKKEKYVSKLFKQLRNAKNGQHIDWDQVGFKPAKILARAESKLKTTGDELKENYYSTKDKTIF